MKYLILLLFPSAVLAQAEAVITAPEEANPGDLIILSAEESFGDDLTWTLANSDKTFLEFEDGRKCVFAAGTPGKYIFVLAVSKAVEGDAGSTVAIARHCVTIRGGSPSPPKPNPNPNPNPTPGPDKPEPVEPDLTGIALNSWHAAKGLPSSEVTAVSRNMKTIAGKAAGLSWSVGQMAKEYAALSRETVFTTQDVRDRWQEYAMFFSATMRQQKVASDAIEAFNAMAEGLDATQTSGVSGSGGGLRSSVRGIRQEAEQIDSTLNSLQERIGQ